ncbi:MAG: glycosyltransferase family 39 protein [Bacteriovoracaceae bacterium]|nr:glycosyltransferase family 39 protein [Bacteriovoracaceae bacterium]
MISRTKVFDKIQAHFYPILLLVSNLLVAFGTELAHDEAYYWLFSKNLAWGYFDHPPMTAWIIALTSWIPGEIGVRLGYIVLVQFSAWLISKLVPKENSWFVWYGFNAFPLLAFSGVFAIPDGPLVILSCLWLWSLFQFLKNENAKSISLIAFTTSALLYSKYHGILFVVATVLALPRLLKDYRFWIAAIFGGALFLPHVYWQWDHGFSTFKYHVIDRPKVGLGWKQPLEYIALQIFLPGIFVGPWLWKKLVSLKSKSEFERSLKFMAIFVPAFFFLSTFSKKVEANWTVAAGIPLILFLALRNLEWAKARSFRILAGIGIFIVVLSKVIITIPASSKLIKRVNEFHGWERWAQSIEEKTPGCHLAANRYQFASKLSFYLKKNVPSLNVGSRLNQFEYWDWDKSLPNDNVCWITNSALYNGEETVAPGENKFIIVRGISLSEILSHKTIEL